MREDIFEVVYMAKKENIKVNYSKIARAFNSDPRTVKKYYERDQNLPIQRKRRQVKKVLDGFEEIIKDKYINNCAPAISIYNLLKTRYGYKGSYSTIKRHTHALRIEKTAEATIRYETSPGDQCQIDWKESLRLESRNNELFEVNIFLGILGFSRRKYIELTADRSQETLFRCLTNLTKEFGGVPKCFLFDNMKTVINRAKSQFQQVVLNDKFYEFSKDMGFHPLVCQAFRPKTKGKVEVVAKIMNRLKAYNNEFDTWEELEKIVKDLNVNINNEIQQTTLEKPILRFEKEKEYLNPLPNFDILEEYFSIKPLTRKVPKDALIMYKGHKYSIPAKYINKIIELKVEKDKIIFYYNSKFICSHKISEKTINYIPEHYAELMSKSIQNKDIIENICSHNLKLFDEL